MVLTRRLTVETRGLADLVNLTPQIEREVAGSGLKDGAVVVFVAGSTAGVSTLEYEPGLKADQREMWQRLVPQGVPYEHDKTWGDENGFSHLRAFLLGPSLTIPIVGGRLGLGTWQQVVLVDFDNRPRRREILLQIFGEESRG